MAEEATLRYGVRGPRRIAEDSNCIYYLTTPVQMAKPILFTTITFICTSISYNMHPIYSREIIDIPRGITDEEEERALRQMEERRLDTPPSTPSVVSCSDHRRRSSGNTTTRATTPRQLRQARYEIRSANDHSILVSR